VSSADQLSIEGHEMKDARIWRVVKETRESKWTKQPDGNPEIYEVDGIQRDDGLVVTREEPEQRKNGNVLVQRHFRTIYIYCMQMGRRH
jgi:hypothetical protein